MTRAAAIAPFVVHGGRLDLARAAFPGTPDWIDLSTGLAPWRYPAAIDVNALARLPDPSALSALEAAAAHAFGAAPERVVAVPGSDIALRLLGVLLPGRAAAVRPGYSGHVAMWGDRAVAQVPADALEQAAETAQAIALARPGNPDGRGVDRARILAVADRLAARGGQLIVDEAFVDATSDLSLAGSTRPGLILLRLFGKFFGLAGVRLGFVIAPPDVVAALRRLLGDWPVSGTAIAVGRAAYADAAWQAAQRARIAEAAAWLDARLAEAGLATAGGTARFRLIETPARDRLFAHLAARGILTRPFSDDPARLRLGLPGDAGARARLATALEEWTSQ